MEGGKEIEGLLLIRVEGTQKIQKREEIPFEGVLASDLMSNCIL